MMAASVNESGMLVRGTSKIAAAPQSAMNGQSLPQSGSEGLPGQHGISSIASADESAITCSLMAPCIGIAMAGGVIGASKRPTMAVKARTCDKTRDMVDRAAMQLG